MMEDPLFAPAFRQRGLARSFGILVVCLVYIATLAIAAEGALAGIILSWDRGMQNRLTVEIPAVAEESQTSQEERVGQIISILRAEPAVASAEKVGDAEVARLLKPWIADPELLDKLPVPTLVSVVTKPGGAGAVTALEEKLGSAVDGVRVDDHGAWLADFSHFIRALALLAGLLVVLTGLALVLAAALVCRTVMATERETISLLHVMGADDETIAGHFRHHAGHLALPAAAVGFVLALLTLLAMGFFLRQTVDAEALPAAQWAGTALFALLVPFAATLAAAAAARHTVLGLLRTS